MKAAAAAAAWATCDAKSLTPRASRSAVTDCIFVTGKTSPYSMAVESVSCARNSCQGPTPKAARETTQSVAALANVATIALIWRPASSAKKTNGMKCGLNAKSPSSVLATTGRDGSSSMDQAKSPPVSRPACPITRLNSVPGNASASQKAAPPRVSRRSAAAKTAPVGPEQPAGESGSVGQQGERQDQREGDRWIDPREAVGVVSDGLRLPRLERGRVVGNRGVSFGAQLRRGPVDDEADVPNVDFILEAQEASEP